MASPPIATENPYIITVHNDIEAMMRALDSVAHDAERRHAIRSIASLADFIVEQSNNANYPLMSSIAESLHNCCRRTPQPDEEQLGMVKSHIAAMAAMISDELDGNGHAMDVAIIDLLRGSARQQNIHPRPVSWPRASA